MPFCILAQALVIFVFGTVAKGQIDITASGYADSSVAPSAKYGICITASGYVDSPLASGDPATLPGHIK
jgi:hypothetical protein